MESNDTSKTYRISVYYTEDKLYRLYIMARKFNEDWFIAMSNDSKQGWTKFKGIPNNAFERAVDAQNALDDYARLNNLVRRCRSK